MSVCLYMYVHVLCVECGGRGRGGVYVRMMYVYDDKACAQLRAAKTAGQKFSHIFLLLSFIIFYLYIGETVCISNCIIIVTSFFIIIIILVYFFSLFPFCHYICIQENKGGARRTRKSIKKEKKR